MELLNNYSDEVLSAKRAEGDPSADLFINAAFNDPQLKAGLHTWLSVLNTNPDLQNAPVGFKGYDVVERAERFPLWADRKLMRSGADFFARHAESIMTLLGLLSLPYCYTAANGAMVLYLSERMRNDAAERLYETAAFVWDVMSSHAFEPGGKGFAAILKVRLMHAAVRYYTLKSNQWQSEWGLPVNQEDMAGTNLSFSLIVIRGLRNLGFSVSYEEQQAYLHLWNVIGYLLGLDETLMPLSGQQARELEAAIRIRQFKPSKQGTELARSLIQYLNSTNTGDTYSNQEVSGLMRHLLGNEVSDMLEIPAAVLPSAKLKLLKTINLVNDLKFINDTQAAYQDAYKMFKQYQKL